MRQQSIVAMADEENLPVSAELLRTMRRAANYAIELREPFISPRALLLALLDDDSVGFSLTTIVPRRRVLDADVEFNFNAVRALQEIIPGEQPAMIRYDTLGFKTPDGRSTMWLSKESYEAFFQGAKRAEGRFRPRDLALGIAAEALLAPGILAAIRVEPGRVIDAV